jgi:hypothetical protein
MMTAILILLISISIVAPILWGKQYLRMFSTVNGVLWLAIEFVSEFTATQPNPDAIFVFSVIFKSVLVAVMTLLFMRVIFFIKNKVKVHITS